MYKVVKCYEFGSAIAHINKRLTRNDVIYYANVNYGTEEDSEEVIQNSLSLKDAKSQLEGILHKDAKKEESKLKLDPKFTGVAGWIDNYEVESYITNLIQQSKKSPQKKASSEIRTDSSRAIRVSSSVIFFS